jgi:hypothetical protein
MLIFINILLLRNDPKKFLETLKAATPDKKGSSLPIGIHNNI